MSRITDLESSDARELAQGFPPVIGDGATVLILGSLPGRRSITDKEYYAQPRNTFWRIMGALVDAGPEIEYEQRLAQLKASSIALWDVVAAGYRRGSLDSAIDRSSVVVNDIASLLARHRSIELICFNGRTAESLFNRLVLPKLDPRSAQVPLQVLPSTSPAHAGMPFTIKLERWSFVLSHLPRLTRPDSSGLPR
jgi:hypoxanthine-DNA glycosylase